MLLTALSFLKSKLGIIDYVLIVCFIAALGWSTSLKIETWSLKNDLSTCKEDNGLLIADKRLYEQAIAQGKKNAEQKKETAEEAIQKAKIVYVDKMKYIKDFEHDNNKTECENAIAILMRNGL